MSVRAAARNRALTLTHVLEAAAPAPQQHSQATDINNMGGPHLGSDTATLLEARSIKSRQQLATPLAKVLDFDRQWERPGRVASHAEVTPYGSAFIFHGLAISFSENKTEAMVRW